MSTIRLHRVFKAKAERVYKAFLDPEALVKFLPPHGFTGKVHSIDPQVGGGYQMSFTNFTTGKSHSFHAKFMELVPNQRLRYTDKFDDGPPGTTLTTIVIREVSVGVDIHVTQEDVPKAIPPEACYLGWSDTLDQLKALVEPEIPDDFV